MSVRKRGGVYHYQFQLKNRTYYGTFPDARSETEARKLERDEKAKVRLGLRHGNKPLDDDFCTFVNNTYLKYARENKKAYKHDECRCKRHKQKSEAIKPRSPVTVHKEVALLSSIFNMALVEKAALENPCRNIPKTVRKTIRARNKRSCPMTPEKETVLFAKG